MYFMNPGNLRSLMLLVGPVVAALAYFAREILGTPFTQLETSITINDRLRNANDSKTS